MWNAPGAQQPVFARYRKQRQPRAMLGVEQLIDQRRNKRRFAAAAQAGDRQPQMAIGAAIDQRVEFVL
ncbi:hypothetical protein [Dickeya fangzhongdai]|uniref:hypothetical protein n=1 Tax=Dickeya fangzhongdai TaxID=1778540 RepID=UPI003B968BDB